MKQDKNRFYNNQTQVRQWFITILLLFAAPYCAATQSSDEIRVLFVGNSYTYYWNLPQTVTAMSKHLGKKVITRQSTYGGSDLKQHWLGERHIKTKQIIAQGGWDYVVFNNHSLSSIKQPSDFFKYGRKFAELVKDNGGQPVFYMTWARQYDPSMQVTITAAYNKLAQITDANVVPIGEIWKALLLKHPDITLHAKDQSHPSHEGSYLNALAFTQFFTKSPITDIPNVLFTHDHNGERFYLNFVHNDVANILKAAISEQQ